jgi:hypothetical protein
MKSQRVDQLKLETCRSLNPVMYEARTRHASQASSRLACSSTPLVSMQAGGAFKRGLYS